MCAEDHKKGLMQQLFPREGETSPRLRFPEFRDAGEWEVKRLEGVNVINLRPNSLFCRKISSIHHHLKESEMNSVPAVPTTDQAVLPKII